MIILVDNWEWRRDYSKGTKVSRREEYRDGDTSNSAKKLKWRRNGFFYSYVWFATWWVWFVISTWGNEIEQTEIIRTSLEWNYSDEMGSDYSMWIARSLYSWDAELSDKRVPESSKMERTVATVNEQWTLHIRKSWSANLDSDYRIRFDKAIKHYGAKASFYLQTVPRCRRLWTLFRGVIGLIRYVNKVHAFSGRVSWYAWCAAGAVGRQNAGFCHSDHSYCPRSKIRAWCSWGC